LANDVFHRLRADIISCTLKPGSRLRFVTLRSVYHVSFTTLREGLTRLASEGLVSADGQRGFQVARVSQSELADVTNARVLVEREVLKLAIERGTAEWQTSVLGAYHRMDQLPQQSSRSLEWSAAHSEFHIALASACESPVLMDVRAQLFRRAERYRRLAADFRTYHRSNADEHREIMEAAIAGDKDLACNLIERHIRRTSDDVAAAMKNQAFG
jgi:DNA-binding GntR family transcriptional regulator